MSNIFGHTWPVFTRAFASRTRASEPRKGPGYEVEVLPARRRPAWILVYPSLSPYERGRTSGTQGTWPLVKANNSEAELLDVRAT
jgi:hypothetical protein